MGTQRFVKIVLYVRERRENFVEPYPRNKFRSIRKFFEILLTLIRVAIFQKSNMASYRPQQKKVQRHVQHFPRAPGFCLCHELGTGKSFAAIGAVEQYRRSLPKLSRALVIVLTKRKVVEGFAEELKKAQTLEPELDPRLYTVTTYETFASRVHEFKVQGAFLVIDEAHNLRNALGKRYPIIFNACKEACKVILLTGTVIVNYPHEVAPLINLIVADPLKKSAMRRYSGEELSGQGLQRYLPVTQGIWNKRYGDDGLMDTFQLKRYFRCLVSFHREDKTSAEYKAHFPRMIVQDAFVHMKPAHYKMYREIEKDRPDVHRKRLGLKRMEDLEGSYNSFSRSELSQYQRRMQEGPQASDSNDFRFLAYMMALRMGCNYMRDDEGNEYMPKVTQVLRRVVRQYRKDPAYQVMIYSYFLSSGVHLYESVLKALGIPYVCISGETDDTAQSKVLYNTGKVRVALLSSAGRAGLDLHYTSEIYLTDRHWNSQRSQVQQPCGSGKPSSKGIQGPLYPPRRSQAQNQDSRCVPEGVCSSQGGPQPKIYRFYAP
jgi:SNF2 family DNA or RNA helicase